MCITTMVVSARPRLEAIADATLDVLWLIVHNTALCICNTVLQTNRFFMDAIYVNIDGSKPCNCLDMGG